MNTTDPTPPTFWGEFRVSLMIAAGLYFIDAIWLGQGGVAMLTVAYVVVFFMPATLLAWYRKSTLVRNLRAAKTALYLAMAVAVFVTIRIDLNQARSNGETIISALKSYHVQNGHYPDQLEQLVPAYLPAIPKARFSLTMNTFHYHATKDSHNLSYIVMPPFGFSYYNLEKGQWAVKD